MKSTNANGLAFRVDFLGPPGVGKSTLCKAVLEHSDNVRRENTAGPEWISMEHARRLAIPIQRQKH